MRSDFCYGIAGGREIATDNARRWPMSDERRPLCPSRTLQRVAIHGVWKRSCPACVPRCTSSARNAMAFERPSSESCDYSGYCWSRSMPSPSSMGRAPGDEVDCDRRPDVGFEVRSRAPSQEGRRPSFRREGRALYLAIGAEGATPTPWASACASGWAGSGEYLSR